jgi:hypothetical protein
MDETTKMNIEINFLLFWLTLLDIGPTLLPTMSPQSAAEVLCTASQMNRDAAGSAARLLVDLATQPSVRWTDLGHPHGY